MKRCNSKSQDCCHTKIYCKLLIDQFKNERLGRHMNNKLSSFFKWLFFALVILPVSVFAGSVGDAADNLMGPTSIVMKVVDIGCYLIGLAFVMMSIAQYKIHRQSPKLVPLATPITLVILGVIALLIPYATKQGHTGKNEVPQETRSSNLPLPGQDQKSPGLPYPPGHQQESMPMPQSQEQSTQQEAQPQQQVEQPAASPSANPYDSGSSSGSSGGGAGGWTTDPRYNQQR